MQVPRIAKVVRRLFDLANPVTPTILSVVGASPFFPCLHGYFCAVVQSRLGDVGRPGNLSWDLGFYAQCGSE